MSVTQAAISRVEYATAAAKTKHPLFPSTPYGMSSILSEEVLEAIQAANDVESGKVSSFRFFEEVEHVAAVCQRILEKRYEMQERENYDG